MVSYIFNYKFQSLRSVKLCEKERSPLYLYAFCLGCVDSEVPLMFPDK